MVLGLKICFAIWDGLEEDGLGGWNGFGIEGCLGLVGVALSLVSGFG